MLALPELDEVVNDTVVEILSSKVSVTSGRKDLKDTIVDGQKGHIEGSSSEIVDNDVALASGLVKTVSDGSGGGLVDDTEDVETGDRSCIFRGLTLSVIEAAGGKESQRSVQRSCFAIKGQSDLLGGNGDNGMGDLLSEVRLGRLLHLAEDHGRYLLCGESTLRIANLDLNDGLSHLAGFDGEGVVLHVTLNVLVIELATNQTLGVKDSVGWVGRGLILGGVSDEALSARWLESDV